MLSSLREVQVGILREKKIDLERKKRREEREKELEKLKAWAPGLAPFFLVLAAVFHAFFLLRTSSRGELRWGSSCELVFSWLRRRRAQEITKAIDEIELSCTQLQVSSHRGDLSILLPPAAAEVLIALNAAVQRKHSACRT